MSPLLLTSFLLLYQLPISHSYQQQPQPISLPNQCNDKCGDFQVPFPFHLNTSCSSLSNAFHLSCLNSTTLFLHIGSTSYRILEFLSDGALVDFPGSSSCRQYNDLNSFAFPPNAYFGLSADNVIGLFDCEDSSLCKAACETIDLPGCDGGANGSPACCYPLSDHSVWHFGDGFSAFSKFGCRGFSCWVVSRGSNSGKRGVKLEWAIPRNLSEGACASNAYVVNATSIEAGVRCMCQDGFVGDGFSKGVGCLKFCVKDGWEAYGKDCYTRKHSERTLVILSGVLAPVFVIASLIALFCLLKKSIKQGTLDHDQAHFCSTISFRKTCRTRLFTYHELEEATKGFEDGQKLVDGRNGVIYAGVLRDLSHIAVQKVQCENEKDLIQVLSRIEILSAVLHRNMARLLGCCIDSGYTPLVVYEYPANGTLEEHLLHSRGQRIGLDWYKRLRIAAETARVLAFLQHEMSPPIFHNDLKSGCIFLDEDFSIKIAGFGLLNSSDGDESHSCNNYGGLHNNRTDVYDLGVMLLEIIAGSKHLDLQKITSGKLEEIVDPLLYYHEQPPLRREQIEIVADIGARCLLFGANGKLGIIDVARELLNVTKENIDGGSRRGPSLEETFSNSSLLQMISTSPDSVYVQ